MVRMMCRHCAEAEATNGASCEKCAELRDLRIAARERDRVRRYQHMSDERPDQEWIRNQARKKARAALGWSSYRSKVARWEKKPSPSEESHVDERGRMR